MREKEAIDFIIEFVYERSRIRLHDGKEALIRARLGKRMRQLNIPTLPEYCVFLQSHEGQDEIGHAIDALTTNFTNFLREEEHFRFMVRDALPKQLGKSPRRFNVWSAACASGEEPYSIGFYLEEHFPSASGWDWRILATDISSKALDKGRQAIYPAEKTDSISQAWLKKYFQRGTGQNDGLVRVKSLVRDRVNFQQQNLLGGFDPRSEFEVIFCRNVMIYFDRPTQERLINHLSRFLVKDGYLLTGHAESLNGLDVPLRCLRPSIYQKNR
jgi:chemotaxis protein methyltransferase CheR